MLDSLGRIQGLVVRGLLVSPQFTVALGGGAIQLPPTGSTVLVGGQQIRRYRPMVN